MKTNIFMTAFAIILFAVTAHAIKITSRVSEDRHPMYQYIYFQESEYAPTYSNGKPIYEGSTVCWDNEVRTDSVYVESEAFDSGLPLMSTIYATRICRKVKRIEYLRSNKCWLTTYEHIGAATISYTPKYTRINTNNYRVIYNSNANEIIIRRWDDSIRYIGIVYFNYGSRPRTLGYCYTREGTMILSKMVTNVSQCEY